MTEQFQGEMDAYGGGNGLVPPLHQLQQQQPEHQQPQQGPIIAQLPQFTGIAGINLSGSPEEILRQRLGEEGVQRWQQMVAEQQQQRAQAHMQAAQLAQPHQQPPAQAQQSPGTTPTAGQIQRSNARSTPATSSASVAPSTPVAPAAPSITTESSRKSPVHSRARGGIRARGSARSTRKRRINGTPAKDSDDETDEEFTMEGIKTKSGRKVHRPTQFDPAVKTPSRRRGAYRRVYDTRICKICQRGHSPHSNMIVFCDGCNAPFHQLCHDPPIDNLVIAVAEAEWFCNACAAKREEKPVQTGLSGEGLTEDEKRMYLASLPLSSLVELIFFCEKSHPDIPLYDPDIKSTLSKIRSQASASGVGVTTQHHTPRIEADTPIQAGEVGGDRTITINGTGPLPAPSSNHTSILDFGTDIPTTNGRPNYEILIVRALASMQHPTPSGSPPRAIWDYLARSFQPLRHRDIRSEAQNSLQKLLKNGRIIRDNSLYKINPNDEFVVATLGWGEGVRGGDGENPGILAPGTGIKLVPETEDDELLVEREEDMVGINRMERGFSHWFAPVFGTGEKDIGVNGDANGVMNGIENGDDIDAEGSNEDTNGILEDESMQMDG